MKSRCAPPPRRKWRSTATEHRQSSSRSSRDGSSTWWSDMTRTTLVSLVAAWLVAACGFHLRGDVAYVFPTISVTSPTPQPIVIELRSEEHTSELQSPMYLV